MVERDIVLMGVFFMCSVDILNAWDPVEKIFFDLKMEKTFMIVVPNVQALQSNFKLAIMDRLLSF